MGIWREVCVQTELFDLGQEEKRIRGYAANSGALVAFQGMVREFNHSNAQLNTQSNAPEMSPVTSLFLEHYPTVTENEIERIVDQAAERWPLSAVQVIHRVGFLHANEPIVLVICCAEHRADAFASAQFIMDCLKTQAPFWKREHHADGQTHWVESKNADADAHKRWENIP